MNKVIYNGTDLTTLGLYVSGNKAFSSPKKKYTKVSVPGRSGDLFLWDGTYSNVDLEYDAIILPSPIFNSTSFESKFRTNAENIRRTLLVPEGYVRIEDDYNPDEFRLGVFEGPLDIDAILLQAGKSKLKFNCRPERFLISGETEIDLTFGTSAYTNNNVRNSTFFVSKPILKITGDGVWRIFFYHATSETPQAIHRFWFHVDGPSTGNVLYLDAETMDFYTLSSDGTIKTNWNSHATIEIPSSHTEGYVNINDDSACLYPDYNTLQIQRIDGTDEGTIKITPRYYVL